MMNKYRGLGIVIISLIITFFFYGKVIISPNSYMFNDNGDGLKNYYTYAYHIKNDSSFTEFEGMNYPYGEHFFYTDSHPVITIFVKIISKIFPSIANYSVGIINFLMLLSIFLTYIVSYYLFRYLKTEYVISLVGAISIGLLAPQIYRLTGHYALSYSVAIPLTWLLTIKLIKNTNTKNTILLFINNLFWLLIHAYLGIIVIGFAFVFFIFHTFKNYKNIKNYLYIFTSVLLPIIIFKLILFFTDFHINRTGNPTGFFLYNAEFDDILIPNVGYLRLYLGEIINIKQQWEAWSYIGFVSSFLLVSIIILFFIRLFKKDLSTLKEKYFDNYILNISLLSAIVLLIFSLGIPFRQFPALLEIFPIFKQFRATGRFDWVFYFVFITFTFYIINKFYLRLKTGNKKILFILIIILFYATEGYFVQSFITKRLFKSENKLSVNYKETLNILTKDIDFEKYQSILPIPFYHFGSEVFSIPGQNKIEQISMLYSYHYNLPMFSAYLTRVSITESKNIISILSPRFYKKNIADEINKNKPILIIESNEIKSKYDAAIIKRSKFLFSKDNFNFYEITPKELFKNSCNQDIKYFDNKIKSKLFYKNGFLLTDTLKFFYFNNFNSNKKDIKLSKDNCGKVNKNEENIIINFEPKTFSKKTSYHLTIWVYNADNNLNEHFRFGLIEYNEKGKVYEKEFYPEHSYVINNKWSLVEFDFKINNVNNKLKLYTRGSVYSYGKIFFDNLMIRDYSLGVYQIIKQTDYGTEKLFFNNHFLEKN